jgi:hypothetical protein
MKIEYNPEKSSASSAQFMEHMQNQWEAQKALEKQQKDSEEYLSVVRKVNMPKLCTIETYDDLIKYVTELYMNGMILGDEFVMKPGEEQKIKLRNSFLSIGAKGNIRLLEWTQNATTPILHTHFGVKIIIK